ncbi:MAG: family 43 glycosylhydrolase, partial [Lachnospiraceae bacterium]|nr:family 43 glycosylhydrolase [Lachnospiraceae bacterium]
MAFLLAFGAMPAMESKAATTGQYTNPLMNGADPTIVRGDDGYFYSGFGTDNDIYIKRSESLLGLSTAESHLVWDNPNTGNPDNNKNYYIWGPYIYRIDGAWYIYYTSSTENDFGYGHPSCYVLENTSEDPFKGEWHLKGSNSNIDDFEGNATEKAGLMNTESYGLACGVISIGGEIYFTYTKYDYYANEPGHTKFNECPTIVKMENPWTLTGPECTVARPTYDWEKHGDNIDEGCAVVEHGGKVYFAYSVSSFTNDNYGVGLSVCDLSTDVMDENNWKKSTTPIVSRSDENASFGPGSPLFVKSPDGTEDWLIYHGGPIGGQTSTDRRVRAQIINWTDDGQISLGSLDKTYGLQVHPNGYTYFTNPNSTASIVTMTRVNIITKSWVVQRLGSIPTTLFYVNGWGGVY